MLSIGIYAGKDAPAETFLTTVKGMMSEAAQKIHECISEVESYQYDAPDLTVPAVNSLKECATLITKLTEENRAKALAITARLYQQALAYAQYVPTSVRNLRHLKEWLETAE